MARNVLESSLRNASFSIIFQILCRFVTFAINAFIVRNVGREVLGIMNVRLLLLESTLIFLSREAISRASLSSQSATGSVRSTWPQLINQVWIAVPTCLVVSLPGIYIWLHFLWPIDVAHLDAYRFGCMAIALSCIVEMTAEAPVYVAQVFCFVKTKILLDAVHILIRSLVFITLVCSNANDGNGAIYAFGIAQMSSAATIVVGNYLFFYIYIRRLRKYRVALKKVDGVVETLRAEWGSNFENMNDFPFDSVMDMVPGVLPNKGHRFNSHLKWLVISFGGQGALKLLLTEGEKIIMSVSPVLSLSEQATYDIVNNMGSMAVRFIFRPIEDSSYFYFTQTIARDSPLKEQSREKVIESGAVLTNLCKSVTSIGLLALVFGQSYAGTVLYLYGGEDFVAGGQPEVLLRWHSLAIVLLALNGITEGFMFATNTSKQINMYNGYMVMFSVTFLFLSYQLTNMFGPVGFILANCTNMIFRICYSTFYIFKQFHTVDLNPLSAIFPGKLFLSVLSTCGLLVWVSAERQSILYHLGFGVICTLVTLIAWAYENKPLVMVAIDKLRIAR